MTLPWVKASEFDWAGSRDRMVLIHTSYGTIEEAAVEDGGLCYASGHPIDRTKVLHLCLWSALDATLPKE